VRVSAIEILGIEQHLGEISMRFPPIRVGESGLLK